MVGVRTGIPLGFASPFPGCRWPLTPSTAEAATSAMPTTSTTAVADTPPPSSSPTPPSTRAAGREL